MSEDFSAMLGGVLEAVRASGAIIAEHNNKARNIRYKGRIDLVTETDLAVEEFLKERLSKIYPEAAFMAEESYEGCMTPDGGAPVWIIDPVDGTTNFAHKIPFVGTSVALWSGGRSVLGVVNAPLLGELFWAARGHGAFCNGEPLKVSGRTDLEKSLVATGFPYTIARDADKITGMLNRVLKAAQGVRRCGAAAIDLVYLAAGRYDVFYESGLKAWDVAAGILLIEEAGGVISRYDGGVFAPGDDDILACAGPELHAAMRGLLTA